MRTKIEEQMRKKFRLKLTAKKRGSFTVLVNGRNLYVCRQRKQALTWLLVWLKTQKPFLVEVRSEPQ